MGTERSHVSQWVEADDQPFNKVEGNKAEGRQFVTIRDPAR